MLADLVRAIHIAFFLFVLGGAIALPAGIWQRRPWVWNPWFRLTHFAAVVLVLVEDVFQWQCPLNVLENNLAPVSPDSPGFLNLLLHHTLSEQTLDVFYWTLGIALLIALFLLPPNTGHK